MDASTRLRQNNHKFACPVSDCEWTGNKKIELKKHGARHKIENTCPLPDCLWNGKEFATVDDLLRHKQAFHMKTAKDHDKGRRLYRCFVLGCGKPLSHWSTKECFEAHIKKKHPYQDVGMLIKKSETWWDRKPEKGAVYHPPSLVSTSTLSTTESNDTEPKFSSQYQLSKISSRSKNSRSDLAEQWQASSDLSLSEPNTVLQLHNMYLDNLAFGSSYDDGLEITRLSSSSYQETLTEKSQSKETSPEIGEKEGSKRVTNSLKEIQFLLPSALKEQIEIQRLEAKSENYDDSDMLSSCTPIEIATAEMAIVHIKDLQAQLKLMEQNSTESEKELVGTRSDQAERSERDAKWDDKRVAELALSYKDMRAAIWAPLAKRMGDDWEQVEKICMRDGGEQFLRDHTSSAQSTKHGNTIAPGFNMAAEYHRTSPDDSEAGMEYTRQYLGDRETGIQNTGAEGLRAPSVSPANNSSPPALVEDICSSESSNGDVTDQDFSNILSEGLVNSIATHILCLWNQRRAGQAFYIHAHDGAAPSSSGTSTPRASKQQQRATQPDNKRKSSDSDEGGSERSDDSRKQRRTQSRGNNADSELVLLACPFNKQNPKRYSERNINEKHYRHCSSGLWSNLAQLKQHLYRVHALPSFYCGNCYQDFTARTSLDEHSKQRPACIAAAARFEERITDEQVLEIKKRYPSKTIEENWFHVFAIIFPDAPLPATPYLETEMTDSVRDFLDFFRREAPPVIESDLQDAGILFDFDGTNTQRILDNAISRLVQAYRSGESAMSAVLATGWPNEFDEAFLLETDNNHITQSAHRFQSTSLAFADTMFTDDDVDDDHLIWEQSNQFQSMQPLNVADEDLADFYGPLADDNDSQGKERAPAYIEEALARSRPKG